MTGVQTCALPIYAEIFYAGGTVAKDVSAAMLAEDLPAATRCASARDHDAVRAWVVSEARPGDTVLVMGARDPDLPELARAVLDDLRATTGRRERTASL